MKTYYILASIVPFGINTVLNCGLLIQAQNTEVAFAEFEKHFQDQYGVPISYSVIDFCLLKEVVRL